MAKYKISDSFIAARVNEAHAAAAAGKRRTRIFYDDHKNAPPGFGVRVTAAGGVSFVLNYYATGAERRLTIGPYGPDPALSITAARKEAAKVRALVLAGRDPLGERREAQRAAEAAAEAKRVRDQVTLAALVEAYVADMRAQGQASADEVEALFERTVADPCPKIAALPLDDVTPQTIAPAFERLYKAGRVRAPEKLAAALKAAFNRARAARNDMGRHAYAKLKVTHNPLADMRVTRPKVTPEAARQAKADRYWTLTQPELAAYWTRIAEQEDSAGAMLRLHLLTGGQRREQLVRLTRADYDAAAGVITLWDGKGRRSEPREHKVPLLPEAVAAIEAMAGDNGQFLVSLDGGATPATALQLDYAMEQVSAAMVAAGEIGRTITPGAIRRSVVTLLGQAGVFKEIRDQLQSRGLHTVQDRHYDMGDYRDHKREALEKLRALCDRTPDNVTPIRRKAG